jgi:septal ring factor EnvC (AmiA/AmiB activator)
MNEIDATAKGTFGNTQHSHVTLAKQEKQQLKDLNKQISNLKQRIKETQEALSQVKAEEEVLQYQLDTNQKKNLYYESDIFQARFDTNNNLNS